MNACKSFFGSTVLAASAVLLGCAAPGASAPSGTGELESHLVGYFSSKAQALADKTYFNIELRIVPAWTDRTDGPWLYVEQADANTPDKPYRQRVYRLERAGDVFVSHIYTFKGDPLIYAGQWKNAKPLATISPTGLELRDGCAVVMARQANGSYGGATLEKACPSELRGARYASSKVTLDAKLLESWDQGFDAAGKQVWGATQGAYKFVKLSQKP